MATIPSLPFTGSQLHTALSDINTEVSGKAPSSHTHTVSQISDINTADKLLMSAAERDKLAGIAAGATVAPVASVGGQTGAVAVSALRGVVRSVSTDTSLAGTDHNGYLIVTDDATVTLPAGLTVPTVVAIRLDGTAKTVTFSGDGTSTVTPQDGYAATLTADRGVVVAMLLSANAWSLTGALDAAA